MHTRTFTVEGVEYRVHFNGDFSGEAQMTRPGLSDEWTPIPGWLAKVLVEGMPARRPGSALHRLLARRAAHHREAADEALDEMRAHTPASFGELRWGFRASVLGLKSSIFELLARRV